MKKTNRQLLAFILLVFVLGVAACGKQPAADVTPAGSGEDKGNEIAENVYHESLSVTSSENGNTVSAQALTFHPSDGYLPVVYATYSGWASTLDTHYEKAADERWGYEVVGIINGSFFSMTDGMLTGITITDGRITCAHTGFSGEMVTFGTDGVMRVIKSALDYKLSIDGKEYGNAMHYFNKVSQAGAVSDKIYYWDSACGTKSDAPEAGYELLFDKVDNSELSVGNTLVGELVSVTKTTEDTKGIEIGSRQFVLYCKTSSSYANSLKDLKPGVRVEISVSETVEGSEEIMENCSSAITNVGWLVKDGEDQTQIRKTIGTHSVTLEARWTAFGTKPDGSYVFFTTEGQATGEGGSVTLRDVARVMMEMGCTNVIRMDGGGSSAMYLCDAGNGAPGFVQSSSRAVSDCIMVVKRSSMTPSKELETSLQDAVAFAKPLYEKTKVEEIGEALSYAEETIARKDDATEGDYKRACMKIANGISAMERGINVAAGKTYTTSVDANATYPDTDNKELTDGVLGESTITSSKTWTAFNGIAAGSGKTYDIIVDLGEKTEGLSEFTVNAHQQISWGIQVPRGITVFVSEDGSTWTEVAATTVPAEIISATAPGGYTFTAAAESAVSGRFIKYAIAPAGEFIFIGEVTAQVHYE